VTNDNLGDWRIDSVTKLAQSFGSAPIGSPIRLMSTAKHKKYNFLSFITPSAPALCLNVAIGAAALGEAIRPRLLLTPMVTHDGKRGSQVTDESIGDLYYFFEQSMISVTMSFQAIEIFANAIIGRRATRNIAVRRKGGVEKNLTPTEAERELSTEEKLGQVLPTLLGVSSPKGTRAWHSFKTLKEARDATVHLKSRDIYTRNAVDCESLFFYFLHNDARKFPGAAIKIISYFFPKDLPRWLWHAKEIAHHDSPLGHATTAL
jgi:hypothetical protein